MDKKYTHCAYCSKKFKKKDEVNSSNAAGGFSLLHADCLHDWIYQWSTQNYFDSYEEFLEELKGE